MRGLCAAPRTQVLCVAFFRHFCLGKARTAVANRPLSGETGCVLNLFRLFGKKCASTRLFKAPHVPVGGTFCSRGPSDAVPLQQVQCLMPFSSERLENIGKETKRKDIDEQTNQMEKRQSGRNHSLQVRMMLSFWFCTDLQTLLPKIRSQQGRNT